MIASALTRVAARRTALSFASASRFVATPSLAIAPLAVAVRSLHISAPIAQAAAKAPATKKPAAKAKTVAKKKPAAKKPATKKAVAKKPAAPKPKPAPKKKPASWELFDANGKPIPLPHKSKPTRRSAFVFYVLDQFPKISKLPENQAVNKSTNKEGIKATAVIKTIGTQWKALSDAEKKPFEDAAVADKAKYDKELAQWEANLTPLDIQRNNAYMSAQKRAGRKTRNTRLRDPAKPKKPATAFFEYIQERRAADGAKGSQDSVIAFTKQLGDQWKTMSEADKEPYVLRANGAREQYKKDLETYERQVEREA